MSTNELTIKVNELKELKKFQKEIEKEISILENEIKEEMIAQETDELDAGIYKVRYKTVVSKRFNSASFKQAYLALYEKFCENTETRRFTII